ncbi:hypothetical protein K2X33_07145 [bacterium]|nr:hypothetical protein [bacterium]
MKIKGRSLAFLLAGALLSSCAREADNSQSEALFLAAGEQYLTGTALSKPEAQQEIRQVMGEIQEALFTSLVPEYAAARTAAAVPATGCKPDFKLQLIGAAIAFEPSATCPLSGTIGIKFFPTVASVDLDVVGLKHIEKIQFDADVNLSQGMQIKLDMTVLNGVISLRALKFAPLESLTANAKIGLVLGGGAFKIDSRVNAFLTTSGLGVALLAKIDRSLGVSNIQACILKGGVGNDPTAGTASTCMRLGNG